MDKFFKQFLMLAAIALLIFVCVITFFHGIDDYQEAAENRERSRVNASLEGWR